MRRGVPANCVEPRYGQRRHRDGGGCDEEQVMHSNPQSERKSQPHGNVSSFDPVLMEQSHNASF